MWQCNGFEISTLEAVHAINFKENYFAIMECNSSGKRHGRGIISLATPTSQELYTFLEGMPVATYHGF